MVRVAPRYVIADPIREPMPIEETELLEFREDELLEELKRVAEEGYGDTSVIAMGLLYIIDRIERR